MEADIGKYICRHFALWPDDATLSQMLAVTELLDVTHLTQWPCWLYPSSTHEFAT